MTHCRHQGGFYLDKPLDGGMPTDTLIAFHVTNIHEFAEQLVAEGIRVEPPQAQ
jgi:hypothetical protein